MTFEYRESLRTHAQTSAIATIACLIVGTIVYIAWGLFSLNLSLHRSLSTRADHLPADGVLRWWSGVALVVAVAVVFAAVRVIMQLADRGKPSNVSPTGVSGGALLGTIVGLFANGNLAFARSDHLVVGMPEQTRGMFWLLVPVIGWAFGVVGDIVAGRRRRLPER
jgi:hypothetical protein